MNRALILILATLMLVFTSPLPAPGQTELSGPVGIIKTGGVALPNGPLPDTGYAAATPPARYYENTTLELIPSPDYGRIWPYIGGWADKSVLGVWSELIGICDDNGRIICDPYYNDVELVGHDGAQMYIFTKLGRENGGIRDIRNEATLASLDGSFVETYDEIKWRGAFDCDYMTARQGGKWGVLDWDGSVLLPFDYSEPVCFSEGLASVLSDNGETVSFISVTGETVLGPFEAPPRLIDDEDLEGGVEYPITYNMMFSEGKSMYYDNGMYGAIDRDGNVVIPAQYDDIYSYLYGTRPEYEKEPPESPPLPDATRLANGLYVHSEFLGNFRWQWRLYDADGNPVTPERPGMHDRWANNNLGENYLVIDVVDGEYLWPPRYMLFDLNGEPILQGEYYTIIPMSGRYVVRGERFAGLLDANGDFIIKVPLTVYDPD